MYLIPPAENLMFFRYTQNCKKPLCFHYDCHGDFLNVMFPQFSDMLPLMFLWFPRVFLLFPLNVSPIS